VARPRVLAIILAGGKGERLYPLTRERGKPAVPFGAKYRIVDFVLSNFMNSGIYALYVLVQYKAQSLIEHLRNAWRLGGLPDHFVIVVPPQMRWGETWYQGTADAVYQNINLLRDFHPDIVAIFGADHVYRMDLTQMLDFHQDHRADITVAALPVPLDEASSFGVLAVDETGRITRFDEKPKAPPTMPTDPARAYASMGNYLFNHDVLIEALVEDARRSTDHDFGRTILPELVPHRGVYAYNFLDNAIPGLRPYEEIGYWRDVGTISAYWHAHMDLLGPEPRLDLDNDRWPILTAPYRGPSTRIIVGEVADTILGEGVLVDGATIRRSIIGRGVRVGRGALVEDSIIMERTTIGPGARLRRAIVDRFNAIPEGARLGEDETLDGRRFHIDPSGLVVVPRGQTR
jgi:glucose-1-phosphate adenylyltransferase